ncbi:hypothetical protein [Jiangella asiatica]|uniref:Uncharacterized protein n=1 Tax=Jiangella asiatica TaxID=2530372 RepID=A0A4R5DGP9_9ACTN|nr:hypothetical protein [Jiangella asiatica]TDE09895.1 hypothetical protein E1269_13040 [Jiangella asiatica]
MHAKRGWAAAVVAVLAVTGCAGPAQQVEVDVRGELAQLGLDQASLAAGVVALPPYLAGGEDGPPANWVVNPRLSDQPEPAAEGSAACPFTDPRQQVVAALESPVAPPAVGEYRFFAEGRHEAVSTDGGEYAVMPAEMTRTVSNLRLGAGGTSYDFDLVVEAPHGTTTTTYRVVLDDASVVRPDVPRPVNVGEPPPSLDPSAFPPVVGTTRVGTPAQPGMYVMSMAADGGEPVPFNAGQGMLLVRWPAYAGDTFHGQATVGTGDAAQHVAYTSTVLDDGVVEACGTRLDSLPVQISATVAPLAGDGPSASVDAVYNVATQFGGVIVADSRTTAVGSDATSSVEQTISARMVGAPRPPGPPPPPAGCPADAVGGPALPAVDRIAAPPVEATYVMRTPSVGFAVSTYTVNGVSPDAGKFPTTMVRTVRNVRWDPTGREYFEYEVADDLGGSVTVTTYRVVPGPAAGTEPPPARPEPGAPGIYLVSTLHPDGHTVTYNDGDGLLIVPFPVAGSAAAEYVSVGTDGTGDVVAASYLSPNTVVEVCGTPVETWTVDVVISPGTEPAPKPPPQEYIDTRLLPPEEPTPPEATAAPPEPPLPSAPAAGPRSGLALMRSYTDLLHDQGHVETSYALALAPALGGLPVAYRSTVSSVDRVETFQQNLAYTLASRPEVP